MDLVGHKTREKIPSAMIGILLIIFGKCVFLPAVLFLLDFYDRADEIYGREVVSRKRRCFMVLFYLVMLAALLLIIGFWNKVTDYKTAYLQSLLFLEVMNYSDVGAGVEKALCTHIDMGCRSGSYSGVSCFHFLRWRWKRYLCNHDIFRKEKWRA